MILLADREGPGQTAHLAAQSDLVIRSPYLPEDTFRVARYISSICVVILGNIQI